LEAWGLKSKDWWETVPVGAGSKLVDNSKAIELKSAASYVRVRWSFQGIKSFTKGRLCIFGRSYSTGASAKFRPWSPIHGDTTSGLVSVYPAKWYCVDWTQYMSINDKPGLLGYRLYPAQSGSSKLAIQAIELCLEGLVYQ
tara:strand:- start:1584 stop:2006 length:423 start_codon:yes stop_codon:yes gene_type:complete